jgi:RNase P/RNase MRP subunit POP5
MVVKSKIGRKRYIIFKIDSNSFIKKRDLIYSLKTRYKNESPSKISEGVIDISDFNKTPWLISLDKNYGLIRCHHLDTDKVIRLLQSIQSAGNINLPIKITTLGTAGTIRSARKKYLDKLILYP